MTPPPSLAAITMLARSGATALAWARLEGGGFGPDDAAALAVRGRLLKDRARAATGPAARALYAEAAAAYARAGAIDGTTYPLINAATLALLGGDAATAAARAADVLALLDSDAPDRETPYYRAATRAEALLLLGRLPEAKDAFAAAIALAPDAVEDHATTLRQFALIHAETGTDAGWLDAHRPGRVLHFAGKVAPPLDVAANADLAARIDALLAAERIGSAYGALAGGADIVIAEALVARGAAVHVVLPGPIDEFAQQSVAAFGAAWLPRFDRLLAVAASIDAGSGDGINSLSIALASERAMGRAIAAADRLATAAAQLVVAGPDDDPGTSTARDLTLWAATGRPQTVLAWPQALPPALSEPHRDERLAALVYLKLDLASHSAALESLKIALAPWPAPLATAAGPGGICLAWPDPAIASATAAAMLAALAPVLEPRIAGHFAVIAAAHDPFSDRLALVGPQAARAARLADLAPPGCFYASDDFLAGLLLRSTDFRHEYVGDAPGERGAGDLQLHAISARASAAPT